MYVIYLFIVVFIVSLRNVFTGISGSLFLHLLNHIYINRVIIAILVTFLFITWWFVVAACLSKREEGKEK